MVIMRQYFTSSSMAIIANDKVSVGVRVEVWKMRGFSRKGCGFFRRLSTRLSTAQGLGMYRWKMRPNVHTKLDNNVPSLIRGSEQKKPLQCLSYDMDE